MRTRFRIAYGFTLVELVASMAIMSVLMLGLGSAMILASHAVPDGTGPLDTMLEAGTVADDIASDLRYAVSFAERSSNAVEFTVGGPEKKGIGTERAEAVNPLFLGQHNRGRYNTMFLITELAFLAGVWIQSGHADPGILDAKKVFQSIVKKINRFENTADCEFMTDLK